jgi:hypothetical protein
VLKKRVKIILKKKASPSLLDYIDEYLEKENKCTGKYPAFIELALAAYEKMKFELKEKNIDGGWARFPKNYRGIPIKLIKGGRNGFR